MTKNPETSKERKLLVLFDAHAIIHRAYHALPDFATKSGEPTGGIYGLATMLIKTISDFAPDYMAACYDLPEPTFRHKEYSGYKAGRAKIDDALIAQLERSRDVFTAFHIPIYDKPGFEADDMLGTIVSQVSDLPLLDVVIVSGDMDTLQLISGTKVRVFTLKKGLTDTVTYGEDEVRARFGFGPELVADFKGLRGDPSDNIIGVPGIGEKTATTLLTEVGDIDAIYSALQADEASVRAKGISPRIIGLLKEHEEEARFSKVLATIRRDAPITFVLPTLKWAESWDENVVVKLFQELEFRALPQRLAVLRKVGGASLLNDESSQGVPVSPKEVVEADELRRISIALWLLRSDAPSPSLEDMLEFSGKSTFAEAREDILAEVKRQHLDGVYHDIELPLIPILARAKEIGILLDLPYLTHLGIDYHQQLQGIEEKIYALAEERFNLNSPKQLGDVLFDKLELKAKGLRKTAGGARSTKESELEKLRGTHDIIPEILAYREIQKLLSTYIDALPTFVSTDGRIHSTLEQTGATTGRMSSLNPNLQNIPVRDGHGKVIRNAFMAKPGSVFLAFDYSQIELRVLAILSKDHALSEIFRLKQDAHTMVAGRVFQVSPELVTDEMRRKAKVINFGIIYGMGVQALKANLGTSLEEARTFHDGYFSAFPTIGAYFDQVKSDATKKGYTTTLFGRRRNFSGLHSSIPFVRASAERMAMNAPLQGTAADLIKLAMIAVEKALEVKGLHRSVDLILQVHDELIFEVQDDPELISKVQACIVDAMEGVYCGEVPLVVNMKQGYRWGEMG